MKLKVVLKENKNNCCIHFCSLDGYINYSPTSQVFQQLTCLSSISNPESFLLQPSYVHLWQGSVLENHNLIDQISVLKSTLNY